MIKAKALQRPDKELEKMLLGLVFGIIAMALSILMLFVFPQHSLLFLSLTFFLTLLNIFITIILVSDSEKALTYGGLANVILDSKTTICRIDNADYEAVIENRPAQNLFAGESVLKTLKHMLFENPQNKLGIKRLEQALKNLKQEDVFLELSKDENIRWYHIVLKPLYLKKNDIFESDFSIAKVQKETYFLWQIEDVTAAKNMEKITDKERQKLHRFIKDMPLGLYVLDQKGCFEYVNDTFAKSIEEKAENLLGRPLKDFLKNPTEPLCRESVLQYNDLVFFKNSKGENFQLYVVQNRYKDAEAANVRGLTLKNLPTDQKLLSDFNKIVVGYQLLFEQNPLGVLYVTPNFGISAFNPKAKEIFETNFEANSLSDFLEKADLEKLRKARADFAKNNSSQTLLLDTHLPSKKPVQLTVVPSYNFEGKKFELNGLLIYIKDTTKSKNLEQQFAQAQKMQAMGQFAGGIAHDFNNLLTAMIGFCDLLLQRHRIGDPSFADLNEIKQNAVRAAALVRHLLAFSRQQPSNPKFIDVVDNLTDLSQFLKRILGEQISLEFHHDANLGFIRIDPVQFTQVIMNLAVNAKDAMNGKGILKISTYVESLIEPYTFGGETMAAGDYVVIGVTDTGCGIKAENLPRIFDPFFSTKQNVVGSGTGLGLATVYGIVTQTKGFIKVESQIDKGTTFKVYLPRFETGDERLVQKTKPSDTPPVLTSISNEAPKLIFGLNVSKLDQTATPFQNPQTIKILFVEDEDSVRAFGVRALKKKGFQVTACASAEHALEQNEKFDLMITDMVMPGMSGAELAKEIRKIQPDIKIILASGYSEEIAKKELAGSQDFTFIAKPYSLGDLMKKVYDVLNEAA